MSSTIAHAHVPVGIRHSLPRLVLLLILLLFACSAFAQEATIVGTVTDGTGAALPNTNVTITNLDTGQSRTLTSNDAGQFVAPGLRIGHYTLKAELKGFKTSEQKGIVLNVGDRTPVEFKLEVGATQESVTVEANTVQVQSESSEVSNVITGQQLSQLASNGRSLYTMVNLTTGASNLQGDFQTPTPVGGDANVSFNGNRPSHNIYLLDGGENLDRGGAGTFSVMPSVEALAEFRILSSNYDAQYGLSSAATMTTVLKSGTKTFHASAWEYLRNDWLDARKYTQPVKPTLRFNTYGLNVGGQAPFGKDHPTFFFYNMEWRKLRQGGAINNQTVPDPATFGGDLSSVTNFKPGLQIMVPSASLVAGSVLFSTCPGGVAPAGIVQGSPFPGNVIPSCMLQTPSALNAQALLNAGIFVAPNGTNGSGQPTYSGGASTPTNVREEIARVDHVFNSKFSIFGHWVSEQISQGFTTTMWSGDNQPTIGNTFGNPSYSAVLHATHTISPTLLNEIAFNYNGNRIHIIPQGLVTAPADFTFNRIYTGPNDSDRIPTINLSSGTGAQYTANWTPWNNKADDYQIRDDLSWLKGSHQIKLGASWAVYKKIQDLFANTQGGFTYNGAFTGFDFSDYLLGLAQQYQEAAVKDSGHWNNISWAAYMQDNWKASPRLTLNLGLRWDIAPHTYEAKHRMTNFYPNLYNPAEAPLWNGCTTPGVYCAAADGTISPNSPGLGGSPNPILQDYSFYLNGIGYDGLNGTPKGLVKTPLIALGPRLGFAYDLTGSGKTVLRGGVGVMYERIQGNDMYNGGTNVPFSGQVTLNNVTLANPKTFTNGNALNVSTLPITVPDITGIAAGEYSNPRSTQFSLGIQRELFRQSILSVSYVGTQNRHQNVWQEVNLPNPQYLPSLVNPTANGQPPAPYNGLVPYQGFHQVRLAQNVGNGHYNSMQLDFRTDVKDLFLQFGYTYSNSIDATSGNGGNGFDLNNTSNPYVGWRYDSGPSPFDRRHVAFVNFVYQVPLLRESSNRALKGVLGGWQLSGVGSMNSGAPIDILYNGQSAASVVPNARMRPDLVGPIVTPHKFDQWVSRSAFAAPADGTWGNLGHDAIRGPGRHNWNLSLSKSFLFSSERGSKLEIRSDFMNAFNHTQWMGNVQQGGINNDINSASFGQITNVYDPRTIQLGMRIVF